MMITGLTESCTPGLESEPGPRRRPPPRARQIPQRYTPCPHVMGAKASKAEAAVVRMLQLVWTRSPSWALRRRACRRCRRALLSRARPPRASARAAAENVAVSNAVRRARGATAPRRLDETTHDLSSSSSSVETPAMTTAARSAQPPRATAASRASPLATPCAARAERQRRAASMRRHTTSARAA